MNDESESPCPGGEPGGHGFRMPAEWEPQAAVWLSWPHRESESYPGEALDWVMPEYGGFARALARFVPVHVNVRDQDHEDAARRALGDVDGEVRFFRIPTDEPWVRDHGPSFVKCVGDGRLAAACFEFNAWGGKYEPHDRDARAGRLMAEAAGARVVEIGLVGEGGAIESNGRGTLMTTASCLLDARRNPGADRGGVGGALAQALGAANVVWLEAQLVGDDTDGHVDTFARFTGRSTIAASLPDRSDHPDYAALAGLHRKLGAVVLEDGSSPEVVPLPVPPPFATCPPHPGGRWKPVPVPAGYANFLVTNGAVLVPEYGFPVEDARAADVLAGLFPGREIVPLPSRRLIWALGSFHCLSQQLPA